MSTTPPVRFDDLPSEDQIKRLRQAVSTLTWWLVQAQSGLGNHDARGIENIIEFGQSKEPSPYA